MNQDTSIELIQNYLFLLSLKYQGTTYSIIETDESIVNLVRDLSKKHSNRYDYWHHYGKKNIARYEEEANIRRIYFTAGGKLFKIVTQTNHANKISEEITEFVKSLNE